jgi:NAD(P)-dependent dehydrogenase (short-subunit alcohol dehydrogenase family)
MDMMGKTVLVTGAASGMGRMTAVRYAENGAANVACLDLHDGGNEDTARLVEKAGAKAISVRVDLGSVPGIEAAYAEVLKEFGRIDAAAHIGGFSWRGDTLDVTEGQWDTVINANLRGCFFCCQQALRVMYEQGSGAIVNMSADAAFYPGFGFAVQAAGKGGIANMSASLAMEAARRGVRVNAVSPGIVAVERTGTDRYPGPDLRPESRPPNPVPQSDLGSQTAPGRYMRPEEIADTFVFLSSDAASGISGALLFVNGGGYPTLQF